MIAKTRFDRRLLEATYLFLALPCLIFSLGWLQPALAAVAVAALVFAFLKFEECLKCEFASAPPLNPHLKVISSVVIVTVLWLFSSGVGGIGFQNGDYMKHNLMLHDLIERSWPVFYERSLNPELIATEHSPLVYYFAYYLPAAVAGKLFGWQAAAVAAWLWTAFGLGVVIFWFSRLVGGPKGFSVAAIWIFPLLGGLDFLAAYLTIGSMPQLGDHVQWWAVFFQYSANTTLLYWVPQHALGGWLTVAALTYCLSTRVALGFVAVWAVLGILWSPFVVIGLLPLVGLAAYRYGPKSLVSLSSVTLAGTFGLATSAFIKSNSLSPTAQFVFPGASFNVWALVFFYSSSFAVYALAAKSSMTMVQRVDRRLWTAVLITLTALPLFRLGARNDFVMRVSIPCLFVFWIFIVRALMQRDQATGHRPVWLMMWLVVGSLTGVSEMWRGLRYYHIGMPDEASLGVIPNLEPRTDAQQYLGSPESLFFRRLAPGSTR